MSQRPQDSPPAGDGLELTPAEEEQLNELLVAFLDADLQGRPLERRELLAWAPLAFGLGLSLCFVALGLHLRKLAREV